MASTQAMGMTEQQKKSVDEMVEKATNMGVNVQAQNSAVVSMINQTNVSMTFNENHNWSGSVVGTGYPKSIPTKQSRQFIHQGDAKDGSQGAVVYYGSNANGEPCGWLLAWCAPTNVTPTKPNRVYVDCGAQSKFDTISWDTIKAKLDVGPATTNFTDVDTETTIAAGVTSTGSFASVGAAFGLST
uniref:Jasmonate-induced protein homolog n=1 Tax=Atriplex canescens TaxID=35922 RepID=JIPH_ATRCA|nr:RecName: Full=Jasmonate-induced protein homolog [Atriplex canescens]AAA86977.1 jasmonate-induced protein homolog; similar to barley jasmonate-induced protein, Swiss-Prot Accession Number P32024 [Atriplex canescens]